MTAVHKRALERNFGQDVVSGGQICLINTFVLMVNVHVLLAIAKEDVDGSLQRCFVRASKRYRTFVVENRAYVQDVCWKRWRVDEVDEEKTKRSYTLFGGDGKVLHSFRGEAAVIYSDGQKAWYKNGEFHRGNDLPAVIYSDGYKQWWKSGQLHRDNDLPAVIYSDGSKAWYKNGQRHCDNGRVVEERATQPRQ